MAKKDPRPTPLEAVGSLKYKVPGSRAGQIVTAIEGGTVTRNGFTLELGQALASGDVLQFTPTETAGTTTLGLRENNAEFSGDYNDLENKPAGAGTVAATMLGTVGNGVIGDLSKPGSTYKALSTYDEICHLIEVGGSFYVGGYALNVKSLAVSGEKVKVQLFESGPNFEETKLVEAVEVPVSMLAGAIGPIMVNFSQVYFYGSDTYIMFKISGSNFHTYYQLEAYPDASNDSTVLKDTTGGRTAWKIKNAIRTPSASTHRFAGWAIWVRDKGMTRGKIPPGAFPMVISLDHLHSGGVAQLAGDTSGAIYIRRNDGQLLQFTGTPVSG